MLAFQLVGALLLLLNSVKGNKKAVIKNCFLGSKIAERDENNNCTIPKEELRASAHSIYLNIAVFLDLVLGYALAAFSPVAVYQTCITVMGVAGATFVLLIAEYYLSRLIAKIVYAKDELVPDSELEGSGIDTTITEAEINAMFHDAFGSED